MLSFLFPALAVSSAVASAFLMQVGAVRFAACRTCSTIYLDEFAAGHRDCSCRVQIIPHLSEPKVTLSLMVLVSFFLTTPLTLTLTL